MILQSEHVGDNSLSLSLSLHLNIQIYLNLNIQSINYECLYQYLLFLFPLPKSYIIVSGWMEHHGTVLLFCDYMQVVVAHIQWHFMHERLVCGELSMVNMFTSSPPLP